MKKKCFIISLICMVMLIFAVPVQAETGKIHSLTLSSLSVTRNSQETFYWLMCNNKVSGYSTYKGDQHAYYSETLTDAQVNELLDNAFGTSSDKDLNFFYFTGHTIFESTKPISGPLGINLNVKEHTWYDFDRLAEKISSYKGRFVVVLDTCGSEAFINDGVRRLNSYDQNRINVICSSGYLKESEFGYIYTNPYLWVKGYRYNGFTYALGKGLGFFDSDNMKADKNKNGSVSIQELYNYIKSYASSHTQLKNNDTKLFSANLNMEIYSSISIVISSSNLELYKNKSAILSATIKGTSQKPLWSSSDSSIASVDSDGLVTGRKEGKAIITCTVAGKSSKCTVTVKNPESVTIKLNKTKVTMYITDIYWIKANTNLKKLKWTSSNAKVATIKNGKIVAKSAGTTRITVSANGIKTTCQVTVKGDWYKKVLNTQASYRMKNLWRDQYETVYRRDFNKYCVVDINHDGIKELMLYNHPKVAIFTYYKGKVRPLMYNSFSRGVHLKNNFLTFICGTSSSNTCYTYNLSGANLKEVINYFHTTSSACPVPGYKINGKKCSKTAFYNIYNKYMVNAHYLY